MWDSDHRMVVISPNVDFDEASNLRHVKSSEGNLNKLNGAFGAGGLARKDDNLVKKERVGDMIPVGYVSEWESDGEVVQSRVTKEGDAPDVRNRTTR